MLGQKADYSPPDLNCPGYNVCVTCCLVWILHWAQFKSEGRLHESQGSVDIEGIQCFAQLQYFIYLFILLLILLFYFFQQLFMIEIICLDKKTKLLE